MAQFNKETEEENFAELFEKSLISTEKFETGQAVDTEIVSISDSFIFLKLSGKSEGVLDRAELEDADGELPVKEGDTIRVFFLHEKNGEKTFTTKINSEKADPEMLGNAFKNGIPVEGSVEKEIKGGYQVRIGGSRAFCPYSQMGDRRSENPEPYVGKTLSFKITEYSENGRNILVSNRIIHEEEREKQLEAVRKTLAEHMVVKGTVASIQDFGAFVDLGGVQALLPISEISRDRIEDVHTVLSVGQEIEGEILSINWKANRISLSMKSLLPDPWTHAKDAYPVDSVHTGKVVRITKFGVFVCLESGLDGLVHISELKGDDQYGNPKVPYKPGDSVKVQILAVDTKNRRLSLKPASSIVQDETAQKYMDDEEDTAGYNPFAALLNKKK